MVVNPARAPSHFSPGGLLDGGKYRIIRQLGAGGMGAVFEAENTLTRKRVAIKCLHAGRASHPDATARLLREAEAASRIRHPHVVDVYDVGRDADSVFLVMEYLEGEPLSQLLARGGMAMHALIALLLPAMRAVAEAHRLGVVHRDIKPDNIFLAREADARGPVPKVLDFGISKLSAHDGYQASLTLSGSTLGTPRYMAYEQLMSDKNIDGRVDVYAFGVILYEALTGQPPFDAETYPELIVKIAHGTMKPPKELRAELPSTLDRLVCWALERDRDRRVSSMGELIRELEPFATERGMLAEMSVADRDAEPLTALALNSTVRSKPPTRAAAAVQPSAAERARPRRAPWIVAAGLIVLGLAWLLFDQYARQAVSKPTQMEASSNAVLDARSSPATPPGTAAKQADSPQPGAAPLEPAQPDKEAPPAASAPERHAPAPLPAAEQPPQGRPRAARPARPAITHAPPEPVRAESIEKPVESAAAPPPPAATTQPVQTQEAPAPSTFRVKLPQSKEF